MTRAASPGVAPHAPPAPARWQLLGGRRPEWWLWAVAGVGWLALLVPAVPGVDATGTGHAAHSAVGGHVHVLGWLAMVAVMAPLVAVNVRYAALRSPRRARAGVTVDVVAGWAVVWIAAAVVLGLATWTATTAAGDAAAIALLTVVAVAWQHAPLKRRSLARCHRVLAPPLDRRRSRRACRRFGVELGRNCVLSCWPLMALMAVVGHAPLVVAPLLGVAWYERRRRPHHDPATTATSLAIAATGAAALVAAYPA